MMDSISKKRILDLYTSAYEMLEDRTPLMFNCGSLCSSACCKDNGLGMLLFPFEEHYQETLNTDFQILKSKITIGDYYIKLLKCSGTCNRSTRPLACRIFPLFPFTYEDGRISVQFDPRAAGTCPLLLTDIDGIYMGAIFKIMVHKTAVLMKSEPLINSFMLKITKELETINSFRTGI